MYYVKLAVSRWRSVVTIRRHLSIYGMICAAYPCKSPKGVRMENARIIRYAGPDALSAEEDRMLVQRARENQARAYAPYSGFLVGAALRTIDGAFADGANQENASYPLCMCGERVALYNAAVNHHRSEIAAIAIVVTNATGSARATPPCGACLQVLLEFEIRQHHRPIRLLLKGDTPKILEIPSVKVLLPLPFDGSFLE